MVSERIQRRIDALLDEADAAMAALDWPTVRDRASAVLAADPENADGREYLAMAERGLGAGTSTHAGHDSGPASPPSPASFLSGRYRVLRLLGRGGRKKVYLARDERLGREVAFAVIPAEGLSAGEKERALREAQAMARLGSSPHLVAIHDIGEEGESLFTVQEFMPGGDVAQLLEEAPDHRPPLTRTLEIARDVCRALEAMHGAGIVHRDLKPANVFLAADGSARVGDLGLAATAGLDRITQHGTMVGTVAYMSPEQALGGEASPAGDLYSFGCMLYEMVTGKPPFSGEDPTAVISQHINTPPVAPSWATEHCPPPLEEILLRLLAKLPADRPASAREALAALEGVDPTQRSASHSDSNALNRLARGVFVGREKELERLRKAFDEAAAGHGGLVMLVGEPGIGKTRTTQELETYARMRGATVLWGRTHESAGAPPYFPWLQVGNQFVSSYPELAGRLQLTPETLGELGRLFPFLKSQPNYVEPREVYSPEAAQFRLFDAYASFLRALAEQTPLLVALDDLHWADKPTLLLLQHVALEVGRSRILIAGNYRDTDITRQSALSETLAALNREPGFARVVLRGLSREETADYIREKARIEPRREVLDRIYEETEGNAFFLSEVVNLMAEEGSLAKDSVSDIAIPDGVKEALGRRLNRITNEANELLQVAAVVGREFTYDTLQLMQNTAVVAAVPGRGLSEPTSANRDDALLALIEEALQARVIEEMAQPGRYRFTHAQMQETLLEELSTTRRVRLHGQVGEALERRYGDRAEENAARLATHFRESATLTPAHAEKSRRYALIAGRQAEAQSAWGEAMRWLELAVEGDDDPDPDVLVSFALSSEFSFTGGYGWPLFVRAMDAFRRRGDVDGFALALARAPRFAMHGAELRPLVTEAIGIPNALPLEVNVRLRLQLIRANYAARKDGLVVTEPAGLAADLKAMAMELGGAEGEAIAHEADGHVQGWAGKMREAGASFSRAAELTEGRGTIEDLILRRQAAAYHVLASGDIAWAWQLSQDLRRAARPRKVNFGLNFSSLFMGALATLRWDLSGLDEVIEDGRREGSHSQAAGPEEFAATVREYQGRFDEGFVKVPLASFNFVVREPPAWRIMGQAIQAAAKFHRGGRDGAAANLAEWSRLWQAGVGDPAQRAQSFAAASTALPWLDAARETLQQIYREASAWKNWCCCFTGEGVDPARGKLALLLDLVDEAEQCFLDGVEWAEREDCPVELGRNYQGLAAVAERRGDTALALDYLDKAAGQYAPRGVKLFLDQVVADKVRLQGLADSDPFTSIFAVNSAVQGERPSFTTHAAADGTVTLMFSDIEDSTAINEQLGDARWMEVLRAHNAVVEREVAAQGGRVVKTIGDGYMVVFGSPLAAVRSAVAIQQALRGGAVPRTADGGLIRVRIGLHTGQAVREGADFFGREVNYAARVASAALGGEVLVSDAVRERIETELLTETPRTAALKGFEGSHNLWELKLEGG